MKRTRTVNIKPSFIEVECDMSRMQVTLAIYDEFRWNRKHNPIYRVSLRFDVLATLACRLAECIASMRKYTQVVTSDVHRRLDDERDLRVERQAAR